MKPFRTTMAASLRLDNEIVRKDGRIDRIVGLSIDGREVKISYLHGSSWSRPRSEKVDRTKRFKARAA